MSDNIGLTPFLLVDIIFYTLAYPRKCPYIFHWTWCNTSWIMLRSNNSFVSSDQIRGAKDLIISGFRGLVLQHWALCVLACKAKYLLLLLFFIFIVRLGTLIQRWPTNIRQSCKGFARTISPVYLSWLSRKSTTIFKMIKSYHQRD